MLATNHCSSFSIHGIGVSHGIAIGRAHLVSNALLEVVHYQLPIDLIDGDKLVAMLESLELGMKPMTTYEINKSFFDEFN